MPTEKAKEVNTLVIRVILILIFSALGGLILGFFLYPLRFNPDEENYKNKSGYISTGNVIEFSSTYSLMQVAELEEDRDKDGYFDYSAVTLFEDTPQSTVYLARDLDGDGVYDALSLFIGQADQRFQFVSNDFDNTGDVDSIWFTFPSTSSNKVQYFDLNLDGFIDLDTSIETPPECRIYTRFCRYYISIWYSDFFVRVVDEEGYEKDAAFLIDGWEILEG